jgi:hypothetical protein
MMPPPNFGRHLDKRRFTNVLRCLKEGPEGCEDDADPWHPVRFTVGGCNKTRKRNFQWGWSAVIDDTMFAWRGKGGAGGMPHLSYTPPRKPEDLGCELKTVCDGTSGVMMHVEIQEGKTRMARKQCHQQCGATTSCTLRCFKESGFAEAHRRPEEIRHAVPGTCENQHLRVSHRGDASYIAWHGKGCVCCDGRTG